MPLKGSDILKKLPKTNCKECGFPTCFAFAMKLASGAIKPALCPYLSPEVRAELEEALAPPMKLITIGVGKNAVSIGEEEVMHRHEKTFYHPPAIALLIKDDEGDERIKEKLKKMDELKFERLGIVLKADLFALQFASGDKKRFEELVKRVCDASDLGLILLSEDLDALFSARDICRERNPLLYPITEENIDRAIPRIKENPTPVAVRGRGIEGLIPLTIKLREAGIHDIVLDPGSDNLISAVRDQTLIRRSALKQGFRPLGYPTIAFPCFMTKDKFKEILLASAFIVKYAGIIVLSDIERHSLFPLLVLRMNIYTDPRKPMMVESKVYEFNKPDEYSPVLVTTNFSLTYFAVSSGIEASKVPSFLCVQNTDGLCVLAGWATGKFSAETIAPFIKKSGIEEKTKLRKLIIPGLLSRIKGELEDNLPSWEIIVGPRDAAELPVFLPPLLAKWKESPTP